MLKILERWADRSLIRQRNDLLAANIRLEDRARKAEWALDASKAKPLKSDLIKEAVDFIDRHRPLMAELHLTATRYGFKVAAYTTNEPIAPFLFEGIPVVYAEGQQKPVAIALTPDE